MKRINKTEARKRFINGQIITVVPRKVDPNNVWGIGVKLSAQDEEKRLAGENGDPIRLNRQWLFDNLVTRWNYYNGCYELGYYPAFYID